MKKVIRCEGWRRHGGVFTLGPVVWQQCENEAITRITVVQDEKKKTFPACQTCLKEATRTEAIEMLSARPIKSTIKRLAKKSVAQAGQEQSDGD